MAEASTVHFIFQRRRRPHVNLPPHSIAIEGGVICDVALTHSIAIEDGVVWCGGVVCDVVCVAACQPATRYSQKYPSIELRLACWLLMVCVCRVGV